MHNNSLENNADLDPVSNVLKWVLLITAIVCFSVVIWGTFKTYQLAPPITAAICNTLRSAHHDAR